MEKNYSDHLNKFLQNSPNYFFYSFKDNLNFYIDRYDWDNIFKYIEEYNFKMVAFKEKKLTTLTKYTYLMSLEYTDYIKYLLENNEKDKLWYYDFTEKIKHITKGYKFCIFFKKYIIIIPINDPNYYSCILILKYNLYDEFNKIYPKNNNFILFEHIPDYIKDPQTRKINELINLLVGLTPGGEEYNDIKEHFNQLKDTL